MTATPSTLYLIDTHAFIYRAFYAMENLRAPDGTPVNAIFQFTRMLANLRRDHRPEYLIAVFDSRGKNFRHDLYPDYKAQRKPTPPELIAQINPIRDLIRNYAIDTCSADGYEADDVIGTLARQAEAEGMQVVIISGDKDLAQLLTPNVRVFDPQKDIFITADDYAQKNGFPPSRLPDLFGLWGDASDNIPGVAGIGEKIGRELIVKYESLENLLDHAGEIKGKRGEVLKNSREVALLSKQLATIRCDAPVKLNLKDAAVKEPQWAELRRLFAQYGFNSLLQELQFAAPQIGVETVDTPEKLAAMFSALHSAGTAAIALAPTNDDSDDLLGVAFSFQEHSAYYLPFAAFTETQIAEVKNLLANSHFPKYVCDYKTAKRRLARKNFALNGVEFDPQLAGHLYAAHINDHTISALALRYLGFNAMAADEVFVDAVAAREGNFAGAELAKVAEYFGETAALTWRLFPLISSRLNETEHAYLREIEMPLGDVLAAMEIRGIKVNADAIADLSEDLSGIIADLRAEIFAAAGEEFNLDSPKQIGEILFDKLQLEPTRKIKTGFSTDEAALKKLASQGCELPALLLDYRQYAKLKNTYLDVLPRLIDPRDRRIHTTFSQVATATGRLASYHPNLQNIPVRSETGRAIRAAFVAESGSKLLAADYSQIELRVLAHFSGDENLRTAFAQNRDVHRAVAAAANHLDESEVSPEQRQAAKAINFGIIYGQSAHGLAENLGIPHYEAQRFIDDYFASFPTVKTYIDNTIAQATTDGFVKTLRGRRRDIPELKSQKKVDRERGEREAINTIIQGSAAEIIKITMLNLAKRLREENFSAQMLLQIHDELLLESPTEELPRLTATVREIMENSVPLTVPLRVEIGVGDNWLELK